MSAERNAAERAAAEALRGAGFSEVRFLPEAAQARTADLLARRAGVLWAVEVRGASRPLRPDATFEPLEGRPLPYPTLRDYLALLWSEKRGQLASTRGAHGCAAAMLLVVVDGEPGPDWSAALARARGEAGSPDVVFALCRAGALLAEPPL